MEVEDRAQAGVGELVVDAGVHGEMEKLVFRGHHRATGGGHGSARVGRGVGWGGHGGNGRTSVAPAPGMGRLTWGPCRAPALGGQVDTSRVHSAPCARLIHHVWNEIFRRQPSRGGDCVRARTEVTRLLSEPPGSAKFLIGFSDPARRNKGVFHRSPRG